jgi:pimeloyl-ACP methyl ester carboxylesterase
MGEVKFSPIRPGIELAFLEDGLVDDGETCGFFWLGGLKSDMTGSKAAAVAALARDMHRPCLRFDYSGHGASGGEFTDGTISLWLSEAVHMFQNHTLGPRIVIGSSMGGWLASLLYQTLKGERIAGLILIAPAHDMTEALMWNEFLAEVRNTIEREGVWERPSLYGEAIPITRNLIQDGHRHLLLDDGIDIDCPVHILQGDADPDVPWTHAKRVFDAIRGTDVRFTLIKNGDHRLSSGRDLETLEQTAREALLRAPSILPDRLDIRADNRVRS